MENNKAITLYELNTKVKEGIRKIFPGAFWIVAEISEINTNQSGHCYLELIEKSENSDQITARAKATIWAFTFRMLKPYFESVTGQRLTTGLKVMLSVSIEFHEAYGFSLNVKDIEPNFTIGDLTRKKQEIIKQLQDEGVFHLNKELEFPLVPQHIAVISSGTAAGYGDFMDQLNQNRYGYKFHVKLFNAVMQGDAAEKSIISALEAIFDASETFDAVVIIRGGGSQADLNCFNSYWLAYHITQFPIPVITGIGHDRDQTIADLVANAPVKTPTAAAELLIEKISEFESYLSGLHENFTTIVSEKIDELKDHLNHLGQEFTHQLKFSIHNRQQLIQKYEALLSQKLKNSIIASQQRFQSHKLRLKTVIHQAIVLQSKELENYNKTFTFKVKQQFRTEKQKMIQLASRAHLLDPVHIMKKGYSLTFKNGMLIKSAGQLKHGDVVVSKWIDGAAESVVQTIIPENQ